MVCVLRLNVDAEACFAFFKKSSRSFFLTNCLSVELGVTFFKVFRNRIFAESEASESIAAISFQ